MSLLIDISALVSARNADDKNHNKALDIMSRALKGEFGKLYISDYIFDETVTIAYIRTGNKNFVNDIGIFARTKPIIFRFIEPIDSSRFTEYRRPPLLSRSYGSKIWKGVYANMIVLG